MPFRTSTPVLIALLTTGCLNSPVLNHTERKTPRQPQFEVPMAECTLSFPNSDLCAYVRWSSPASTEDAAAFRLHFYPAQSSAVGPYIDPGHSLALKLWMPMMGHGSSPVTIVPAREADGRDIPGVFDVSDVYFIMSGDWEVWVSMTDTDGTVIEKAKLDVSL